jgi:AAA+ ATPase superfamily predicted ATPase
VLFINRDEELSWLADGWPPKKAQLKILYGRRRVGKSALLDEFARDKRCVLYQAVEGAVADQLRDLTTAILVCDEDAVLQAAPLANWEAAFAQLSKLAAAGPLLVVFDEYQYAAESEPTLASRLQRWWSRDATRRQIYLVLCGSYVRFFEKNVLAGPAYGRATGVLQLRPLSYRHLAKFFPAWNPIDWIRAYAMTGGIPYYLEQLDPTRSLVDNIQHHVLRRGALLYQEAELLLREELREPRIYYSILRAMSEGCTRVGEIAGRVGLPTSNVVTSYLNTLQALGLIEYRAPITGETSRRGLWAIADPYLRFWFRFVLPHKVQLDHGVSVDQVYTAAIAPQFDQFVARPTFEDICRDWLTQRFAASGLATGFDRIGAWWGPVPDPAPDNPRRQKEGEIELVGMSDQRVTVVGEAKWSQHAVDFGVLNHLRDVARFIPGWDASAQSFLFGRDFEPRLRSAAAAEGVILVTPVDLFAES